ncbi:MAG: NTP transferase domain-containing protein, partial [Acidimicrobiales bacterium]|nr:NTP transferase domain-containing protein [Acidimicrobiales bacterium]
MVAAGSGDRFGGPKQLAPLGTARVVDEAVRVAVSMSAGVVVVVGPEHLDDVAASLTTYWPGAVIVVAGGASRSASVRAGLDAAPEDASVVLIHDAARPLASPALYERVIAAVEAGADAVVPGVPLADTIRRVDGGVIDRASLHAVQTPQGFPAAVIRAAHAAGADASDDATLVEQRGGKVVVVEGEPENFKITV